VTSSEASMRVSVFIASMISSVLADFNAMEAPLVGLACVRCNHKKEMDG